MTDRLISADALLKEWRLECGGSCFIRKDMYCMHYDRTKGVCTLIIKAPTVEPIKHGRWIWDKENDKMYCSECGYETDNWGVHQESDPIEWQLPNYCENCGAKMYGGEK